MTRANMSVPPVRVPPELQAGSPEVLEVRDFGLRPNSELAARRTSARFCTRRSMFAPASRSWSQPSRAACALTRPVSPRTPSRRPWPRRSPPSRPPSTTSCRLRTASCSSCSAMTACEATSDVPGCMLPHLGSWALLMHACHKPQACTRPSSPSSLTSLPPLRALGCLDPQCSLCQHNPNRRCTVNFDRKYLVHDMLKVQAVHAYLLYACKQYGTLTSSSTILAMS